MATRSKSRGGGRGADSKIIMNRLSLHLASGTVSGLFEDDYFIPDLIKTLYEDGLDYGDKMEILSIMEQEICQMLDKNSVDQVITALIDMFLDIGNNPGTMLIASQLLVTITTTFIHHDEYLESELCVKFISLLVDLLKKVNNVGNRRLRAIACNCLGQMEAWKTGVLWKWKDTLNKLAREERSDISQDYIQLLVTIMNSSLEESKGIVDDKDALPVVSYAMENMSYLTSSGILAILYPVIKLVQKSQRISPTVFKPLMLQYLPCNDLNVFCLMLHIQNHFRGELLSPKEEEVFLRRRSDYINHSLFPNNARLLGIHWLTSFVEQNESEGILNILTPASAPSVFQSLDIHTCLLAFHLLCKGSKGSQYISKDLYYLTQLAETTGGTRVTAALYYLLYLQVCHCSSETVHEASLRITRNLFQSFPHLIPLIVDFLQAVKTSRPETLFHGEILTLLHKTVLSLPLQVLLTNYHNYLQVWILSAQDPSMSQQKQLRRLLELVQEASTQAADDWTLGSLILSICRSMMLCHHTDTFYPQMGDLLFWMMHQYGDLDIRDHARFYYALLTLSSDDKTREILSANIFEGMQLGENIADFLPGSAMQAMPTEIIELDHSPITLKRSQISILFEENHKKQIIDDDPKEFLQRYRKKISLVNAQVECQYSVSIIEETEFSDMVAVSFCVCDKKEPVCEDVDIPFLLKEVPTDVKFKFSLKVPLPLSLYPSATFGHNKTTYHCDILPLQLRLQDFLVPFPWHQFSFSNRQLLFNALWKEFTEGSSETCEGIESVKILKRKQLYLYEIWKDAIVNEESNSTYHKVKSPCTDCYLFFMPPSYHLLFQADARADDIVLKIATDFQPAFGYLDEYLDAL